MLSAPLNNCFVVQYLLVPKMACGASNSEKKLGQFCFVSCRGWGNLEERHGKRYNSRCVSGLSLIIAPRAVGVAGCKYECPLLGVAMSIALHSVNTICVSASGDSGAHD